jgi:hypothetical protein
VKHPAQVHERDRIQRAATQRMSPGYTYRARQRPAEMLQSVACLAGTGKTVAVRAAAAGLDPARHTVIYIGNPTAGTRGILARVVTALGGRPVHGTAALAVQAWSVLAGEAAERGRTPVLIIDLCRARNYADSRVRRCRGALGGRASWERSWPCGRHSSAGWSRLSLDRRWVRERRGR